MTDYSELAPFATGQALAAFTQGKILQSDPRVDPALLGASTAIRRMCGWHVSPSTATSVTLDGPGGHELDLPTKQLTAVTAITEGGTVLDVSTLAWSVLGEVRKPGDAQWTTKYGAVQAQFTHGFDDVSDLQQVVLSVVARFLFSPSGATREQAGQVSVQWATTSPGVSGGIAFLAPELAIIDTYRIP